MRIKQIIVVIFSVKIGSDNSEKKYSKTIIIIYLCNSIIEIIKTKRKTKENVSRMRNSQTNTNIHNSHILAKIILTFVYFLHGKFFFRFYFVTSYSVQDARTMCQLSPFSIVIFVCGRSMTSKMLP